MCYPAESSSSSSQWLLLLLLACCMWFYTYSCWTRHMPKTFQVFKWKAEKTASTTDIQNLCEAVKRPMRKNERIWALSHTHKRTHRIILVFKCTAILCFCTSIVFSLNVLDFSELKTYILYEMILHSRRTMNFSDFLVCCFFLLFNSVAKQRP